MSAQQQRRRAKAEFSPRGRGITLYPGIRVTLNYQNFGSAWLGILRGKTEDIELVFNGLFNYCASNGDMEFQNHTQTLATFWGDRKSFRRFFFNQYFFPRYGSMPDGKLIRRAMRYAHWREYRLRQRGHEEFLDFEKLWGFGEDVRSMGAVSAERPDDDFKDAVVNAAFKPTNNAPDEVEEDPMAQTINEA